jgi:hypothetical protein
MRGSPIYTNKKLFSATQNSIQNETATDLQKQDSPEISTKVRGFQSYKKILVFTEAQLLIKNEKPASIQKNKSCSIRLSKGLI